MKKIFLTLLISLFCANTFSQTNLQDEVDKFFRIYQEKEDPTAALDTLFSTNPWFLDRAKDIIAQTKVELSGYTQQLGKMHGYEQLISRPIGDHLHHFTYFAFFDRQPMRFNFIFYKANDKWGLFHFKYDDRIADNLYENSWMYFLDQNKNN